MRIRYASFLLLLILPSLAYSQSALNFPKSFAPAEMTSTGFAVVNPGSSAASASFVFYSENGSVIATATQNIPAAGQLALLGSELFPGVTQAGWVQITSGTLGLQGFWVGGDFATFTDGADAAATSNDLVFPLITTNTELNLANTTTSSNSVMVRLFAANGTELAASATRSIAAKGVLQTQTAALFPSANLDDARYVRVTGAAGLAGAAVVKGFLVNESAVTNAVNVASAVTDANFPHVVSGSGGGGNWTTVVGVTNLASSPQTVSITFTPKSGGSPVTVSRTIAANGSLRETAQNLFSFPSGFQDGWVRIAGTAPLTAFVCYADSVSGGLAVVPVQPTARTTLLFAHIADLPSPPAAAPGWYTGIALLNTNNSDATVSVYAMNPDGTLIGGADGTASAQFTLKAGSKAANLLSELIPQTQLRTSDGGFIFVSSTQPLYGLELFFLRNLRIIANVAAGTIPAGITFTPPSPVQPFGVTSISPARAPVDTPLTFNGSGFSSPAGQYTVVFTGASGDVPVPAESATSSTLTVTIPATAISGPVFVRTSSQISSTQILEVLATPTSLQPGSTVMVSTASTVSGVDIYVPPPSGTVNATRIGIGDPGSSILISSSSVDITRGQSKVLVVGGTGMNSAAGTTVSISGTGITIGGMQFQDPYVFLAITVSNNAATGPRNVIVTNSNLDVSVLSGGLFVR